MSLLHKAEEAIYLYNHGYLDTLNNERRNIIIGKNDVQRLRNVFSEMIMELKILVSSKKEKTNYANCILCLVNSKNNYEALRFLDKEPGYILVQTPSGNRTKKELPRIYLQNKFFYSLLFLFYIPFILASSNRKYLALLHKGFGVSALIKRKFKNSKPNAIIFTNDHTPLMRSFLVASKAMGIKTIYIQHASVSKYFPPLHFDLALLDGEVSGEIYRNIAPTSCEIRYIGIPKLDSAIQNNRIRHTIKKIGLAINQNDDSSIVKEIINGLKANGYIVVLRMHPLDNRKIIEDDSVVNGNKMTLFEFICQSDFLIAGDSSIHLEANSLLCRSVYFKLHNNKKSYDYYKFIKNGLIDEVACMPGLINYLKSFSYTDFDFTTSGLKYFNSSIGEKYYGYSGRLAVEVLNNFLAKKMICLQ